MVARERSVKQTGRQESSAAVPAEATSPILSKSRQLAVPDTPPALFPDGFFRNRSDDLEPTPAELREIEERDETIPDSISPITVAELLKQEPKMIEDPVRLYLQEIAQVPLLDHQSVVALAAERDAARLAARDSKEQAAKESALAREREINDRLVRANLRYVAFKVKSYKGRGLTYLDLIQEGNLGLMKAVERFDYTKGFRFTTYAGWWVRAYATKAIADQSRGIRIPGYMHDNVGRYKAVSERLRQESGDEPTVADIAEEMGKSPGTVEKIRSAEAVIVSLHAPMGEDGQIQDILPDEGQILEELAEASTLSGDVRSALATLPDDQRRCLDLLYGFTDGRQRDIAEVGRELGITYDRAKSLRNKAHRALHAGQHKGKLKSWHSEI